jgi:hypothetical protein
MCGPAEVSSADWEPKAAMSGVENEVIHREMELKLCQVFFDVFERNVKRFGYTGRLTDNLLHDIADDIKL